MHKTLDILNFMSRRELEETEKRVYNATDEKTEFIDHWGVWKGKHVTTQHWVVKDQLNSVFSIIQEKLQTVLDIPFVIEKGQILESYLAYDLHTDYHVKVDHVAEELEGTPYYTLIIPLADFQSHTVVFDQSADYNDFYLYKERNPQIDNHISDEDWLKYCSHCWSDDQKYVTLENVCSWKQGKLIGFDRQRFHSSDNFTKELQCKQAFVLWLREQ